MNFQVSGLLWGYIHVNTISMQLSSIHRYINVKRLTFNVYTNAFIAWIKASEMASHSHTHNCDLHQTWVKSWSPCLGPLSRPIQNVKTHCFDHIELQLGWVSHNIEQINLPVCPQQFWSGWKNIARTNGWLLPDWFPRSPLRHCFPQWLRFPQFSK